MVARTDGTSKLGSAKGRELALRKKAPGAPIPPRRAGGSATPLIITAQTEWLLPFRCLGYRCSGHSMPVGQGARSFLPPDTIGLVQKELSVAQGCFRILIDRHNDCLDVLVAPTFRRRPESNLGQGLNPGGMLFFVAVPLGRFGHHERPPKTLPSTGACSFFSRSRSAHNRSMLMSIFPRERRQRSSRFPLAEAAEFPRAVAEPACASVQSQSGYDQAA